MQYLTRYYISNRGCTVEWQAAIDLISAVCMYQVELYGHEYVHLGHPQQEFYCPLVGAFTRLFVSLFPARAAVPFSSCVLCNVVL